MSSAISVEPADLDSADARALIAELDGELSEQYPEPGATHFRLDTDEVGPERGGFYVARRDGRPVGCGAVRLIDPGTAEVKRMYVAPDQRGRGVGRALLAALEQRARDLGATAIALETGVRQRAAIALYERAGYTAIDPFGAYVDSPLSVCLGKQLA